MVLGRLPPGKIAPNPKTNPSPNPSPNRGAIIRIPFFHNFCYHRNNILAGKWSPTFLIFAFIAYFLWNARFFWNIPSAIVYQIEMSLNSYSRFFNQECSLGSIIIYRSSRRRVFWKEAVLKNFAKSSKKFLCYSVFLKKLTDVGLHHC